MASMGIKFTPLTPGGFHCANDIDTCGITLAPQKKVDTSNLPLLWFGSNDQNFNWDYAPLNAPNLEGFGIGIEGFSDTPEQAYSPSCGVNSPSDEEYDAIIELLSPVSASSDSFPSFDQYPSNPSQSQSPFEDNNSTQSQELPISLEDLEKMLLSLDLPPNFPLDEATLECFASCSSTSTSQTEGFDSFLHDILSEPVTA